MHFSHAISLSTHAHFHTVSPSPRPIFPPPGSYSNACGFGDRACNSLGEVSAYWSADVLIHRKNEGEVDTHKDRQTGRQTVRLIDIPSFKYGEQTGWLTEQESVRERERAREHKDRERTNEFLNDDIWTHVDCNRSAGKPVIAVPCCVFPSLFPERRFADGYDCVAHLWYPLRFRRGRLYPSHFVEVDYFSICRVFWVLSPLSVSYLNTCWMFASTLFMPRDCTLKRLCVHAWVLAYPHAYPHACLPACSRK